MVIEVGPLVEQPKEYIQYMGLAYHNKFDLIGQYHIYNYIYYI